MPCQVTVHTRSYFFNLQQCSTPFDCSATTMEAIFVLDLISIHKLKLLGKMLLQLTSESGL